MKIKVSIIVPVYNVQEYILKSIKSIVNQTLKEIEIIIVNDGTKDNSIEVIEKIIKNDNRITLINQKNKGLGAARNTGIQHARGKYVAFVDSDDWIEKDMYEKLYKFAEVNTLDCVSCFFNEVYENDRSKEKEFLIFKETDILIGEEILKSYFQYKMPLGVWDKIFRLDLIKINNVKFENNIKHEDLPFVTKFLLNSLRMGFINKAYYNYFQRSGSITKVFSDKSLDMLKSLEVIEKRLKNYDINIKKDFLYFKRVSIFRMFNNIAMQSNSFTKNKIEKILKEQHLIHKEELKKLMFNSKTLLKLKLGIFLFLYFLKGYILLGQLYYKRKMVKYS